MRSLPVWPILLEFLLPHGLLEHIFLQRKNFQIWGATLLLLEATALAYAVPGI